MEAAAFKENRLTRANYRCVRDEVSAAIVRLTPRSDRCWEEEQAARGREEPVVGRRGCPFRVSRYFLGLLPIERHTIFRDFARWPLAQSHRLQRLASLDVVGESGANLGDEAPLILRIPEGS